MQIGIAATKRFWRSRTMMAIVCAQWMLPLTSLATWDIETPTRWDHRHQQYSLGIVQTADRIDRFFGGERLTEENQTTRLTLGAGFQHERLTGTRLISDIKLRLVLPRTQQRLQFIVDEAMSVDTPDDEQEWVDTLRDSRPDAGLRYIVQDSTMHRVSGDVGMRLRSPVQGFGRVRWRKTLALHEWEFRAIQSVYWFTKDRWRITSEAQAGTIIHPPWFFQSVTGVSWSEIEHGVTPSHAFVVTRSTKNERAWRWHASAKWPETPSSRTSVYQTGCTLRQRFLRDWLFIEIGTAVEFPQEYQYQTNPVLRIKLDVIFGPTPSSG